MKKSSQPPSRLVTINQTPLSFLQPSHCISYIDQDVLGGMTQPDLGSEIKVELFKEDAWMTEADLDERYASLGIVPVDIFTLILLNGISENFAKNILMVLIGKTQMEIGVMEFTLEKHPDKLSILEEAA